ncbi:hypothetical protein BGZ76_005505 [Entomortierella beljakovae]|nr:hypothetical protein BGZ76_005505 [Entomortierella beljakovae]
MIIMGTAGISGDYTSESGSTGCLLYATGAEKDPLYNNTFCQFPVIGTGVIVVFTLFFLGYCAAVVERYEDFLPSVVSQIFIGLSIFLGVFAFAICGEIGIGLNIACRTISSGGSLSQCMTNSTFQALYTAQVCAGLMGGFWIVITVLEYIQLKKQSDYEAEQYAQETQQYYNDQAGEYPATSPAWSL